MKKIRKVLSMCLAAVLMLTIFVEPVKLSAASNGETPITPNQAVSEMTWGVNLADLYMTAKLGNSNPSVGYHEFTPKAEFGIGMWSWYSSYYSWIAPYDGYNGTFTISSQLPSSFGGADSNHFIRLAFMTKLKGQTIDFTLSGSKVIKTDGTVEPLECLDRAYIGTASEAPDINGWCYYAIENVPGLPAPSEEYAGATFETTVTVGQSACTTLSKSDYYYAYGRTYIPKEEITNQFIGAGANVIRLPVTWTPFVNDTTFEIDEEWLAAVRSEVDYILSRGAYCILNMHEDYLGESYVGTKAFDGSWTNLHWERHWMDSQYKEYVDARFAAIWKQIAEYFKDYSYKLIFEPCNEPTMAWNGYNVDGDYLMWMNSQCGRVNELNRIFYNTVRGTGGRNSNRLLTLVTAEYNQHTQLSKLEIPANDNNLAVQVHCYILDDLNVNYNYDYKSAVDNAVSSIKSFRASHPDIPIIIGETGASLYYSDDLQTQKVTYLFTEAKKIGVPCLWWEDFCSENRDLKQYWIYNKVKRIWGRPSILKAIQDITGIGITSPIEISINGIGYKTEYEVGEDLDVSNLTILVKMNDGSSKTVAVTPEMVSGFDSSFATGRQTLTVTYDYFTVTYDISIGRQSASGAPQGLVGVKAIVNPPENCKIVGTTSAMEYAWSEEFSYTVGCDDGETYLNGPGTYYVRYKETSTQEASPSVKIEIPDTIASIRVNSTNHKTEYKVGEPLNIFDLTVYAELLCWDGYTYWISDESMVTGFDSSYATDCQTLTITVDDCVTTYDIRITKWDDREAPNGEQVTGVAPSEMGGGDGKIIGTTNDMEYSTNPDFSDAMDCSDGETTGLSAGSYYVRYKENNKYFASGWIYVEIPDGTAAEIIGISVNSTNHKTVYKAGEPLDVTGLTILVDMSYGDDSIIPVTESMITGFDSSAAIAVQTLTITYEGVNTTFDIQITHKESTDYKHDDTDHWHYCEVCGEKISTAAHTYDWTVEKEATEEAEGLERGICSVCEYETTRAIPKINHEHKYDEEWLNDEANHWHECKCGEKINAAAHTYDWTVEKEATEEAEGLERGICSVCEYETTRAIPKINHEHKYDEEWLNDEANHWHECKCGEKSDVAAHAWDAGEEIIQASCTTDGEKIYTCTICRYTRTEKVPALGHSYADEWSKDKDYHWHAATCEHTAEVKDKASHDFAGGICSVCGYNRGWTLDESGVLTITTDAGMTDWAQNGRKDNMNKVNALVIQESVTSIADNAFWGCSGLASITIPEGVTSIGSNAFNGCTAVKEISIPKTIDVVGEGVFNNCTSLKQIYCEAESKPSGWDEGWKNGTDAAVNWGKTGSDYIPGDVNGDGKVNNQDAIYLLKHVMSSEQYKINQSGDMNGDGKLNNQDAIYLLKHILNPSQYPLMNK